MSSKTGTEGHKLRHMIADKLGSHLDIWGRGIRDFESKGEILRRGRFSLVIESVRIPGYFSEKIIDCLSVGTIPIYWGDPFIERFFDRSGLVRFRSFDQLEKVIHNIEAGRYEIFPRSLIANMNLAKTFRAAEDRIRLAYADLWDPKGAKREKK